MNIEFLVVSYLVCMFVDWIFQWDWQAISKSKWGKEDNKVISYLAVISHSMVYASLSTLFLYLIIGDTFNMDLTCVTLLISHMIIDTRIPVKLIMRFKGMKKEQIDDYVNFGFMHIGIDHRLHELVLLILAMIV